MTDGTYNVIKPDNGAPIKAWTKGDPLEDAACQQLRRVGECSGSASRCVGEDGACVPGNHREVSQAEPCAAHQSLGDAGNWEPLHRGLPR